MPQASAPFFKPWRLGTVDKGAVSLEASSLFAPEPPAAQRPPAASGALCLRAAASRAPRARPRPATSSAAEAVSPAAAASEASEVVGEAATLGPRRRARREESARPSIGTLAVVGPEVASPGAAAAGDAGRDRPPLPTRRLASSEDRGLGSRVLIQLGSATGGPSPAARASQPVRSWLLPRSLWAQSWLCQSASSRTSLFTSSFATSTTVHMPSHGEFGDAGSYQRPSGGDEEPLDELAMEGLLPKRFGNENLRRSVWFGPSFFALDRRWPRFECLLPKLLRGEICGELAPK